MSEWRWRYFGGDTHIVTCLHGAWPQSRPALGETYVRKLQDMCLNAAPAASFSCYSDRSIGGVWTRRLPDYLPGWWGKLYAFAADQFPLRSRVLVMDLDTVVRRLDKVLDVDLDKPVFIRDAHFRKHAGSGIFTFRVTEDTWRIFSDFPHGAKGPPFQHPAITGPLGLKLTDEHWIHQYIQPDKWRGWDEMLPGRVVSYKHDLHQSCEPLPEEVDVVFFDGEPRPHDVVAEWNPHWRGVHDG